MDRKIVRVIAESGSELHKRDGEITEFWKETKIHYRKDGIRDFDNIEKELWYKQNNREINGKYVIEIEWEG